MAASCQGCRRDEARHLRWDWIEGGRAALPDSKVGPRAIWLAGPARALLAARPRTSGFVFARDEQPVGEAALSNAWGRLRAEAGLDGVRLHDLRHSFASVALGSGETLRTLAGLMGHAELATTEAYAHLAETPVREAAERMPMVAMGWILVLEVELSCERSSARPQGACLSLTGARPGSTARRKARARARPATRRLFAKARQRLTRADGAPERRARHKRA